MLDGPIPSEQEYELGSDNLGILESSLASSECSSIHHFARAKTHVTTLVDV